MWTTESARVLFIKARACIPVACHVSSDGVATFIEAIGETGKFAVTQCIRRFDTALFYRCATHAYEEVPAKPVLHYVPNSYQAHGSVQEAMADYMSRIAQERANAND